MRRYLKKEMTLLKAAVTAPKWEQMGTPGLMAQTRWCDSRNFMHVMFLSMTPPIHVDNDHVVEYIESCISGAVQDRITKEDVSGGEVVQL